MSKAEELAEKAYPAWRNGVGDEFSSNSAYYGFIEGYQQAEKDLELTWKDIADILDITDVIANDDSMEERLKTMSEEEYCQEVLERYKRKEK